MASFADGLTISDTTAVRSSPHRIGRIDGLFSVIFLGRHLPAVDVALEDP